jgi:hypothetical protein
VRPAKGAALAGTPGEAFLAMDLIIWAVAIVAAAIAGGAIWAAVKHDADGERRLRKAAERKEPPLQS